VSEVGFPLLQIHERSVCTPGVVLLTFLVEPWLRRAYGPDFPVSSYLLLPLVLAVLN
ncbi:hypothetical protein L9F63_005374, partial [Diploptera punctata]